MVFNKKQSTILILLLLFLLSVLIRLPALNRPLSNHHEWLTAHVLRTEQIWYEKDIEYYGYQPIMTYENEADRHISNTARLNDSSGKYYYTSYPPFSFFLPYIIFRTLNIYPEVLPLQTFNLILHFINCCLIYILINSLTGKKEKKKINTSALIGFGAYLFSPSPLWYHSNVYFADTLAQTFFISALIFALRYTTKQDKKNLYPFFTATFLLAYTEWIGCFFTVALLLYALLNRKEKTTRTLFYAAMTASILAASLTVWQYSQIDGFNSYINSFTHTLNIRSSPTEGNQALGLSSPLLLIQYYFLGYGPVILTILLYAIIMRKNKISPIKNKQELMVLFLSLAPAFMHHLGGINFTLAHDFSTLKTGIFLSVLVSLLYKQTIENNHIKNTINAVILIALTTSAAIYLYSNAYIYTNPVFGINSYLHTEFKEIGTKISQTAGKDEVVFIKKDNYAIQPQLVFYAHRNIAIWTDNSTAKELIKNNNATKGIIYELSEDATKIKNSEYIYPA